MRASTGQGGNSWLAEISSGGGRRRARSGEKIEKLSDSRLASGVFVAYTISVMRNTNETDREATMSRQVLVSFDYDDEVIEMRRRVAPDARWDGAAKAWTMTEAGRDALIGEIETEAEWLEEHAGNSLAGDRRRRRARALTTIISQIRDGEEVAAPVATTTKMGATWCRRCGGPVADGSGYCGEC